MWLHFQNIPYDRYNKRIPWCWYSSSLRGSCDDSEDGLMQAVQEYIHPNLECYKKKINKNNKDILGRV